MRNLNFLRKSERKSVGTTLALTVGSPSAHRRYSALKHLTFMLLFLLGSLNVWAETVTYTVTSKTAVSTSGTAPDGSSASLAVDNGTNAKEQLTSGNTMTLTLSGYAGYKITAISLSMKSNSSKGAGSFEAVAGTTTIFSIADSKFNTANWNGAWSTSYVNITPAIDDDDYEILENEDVVMTIIASANSIYCQSFTITYEEAGSTCQQLAAPANPSSTPAQTSVVLSWDAVEHASGYKVVFNGTDYDIASGTTKTIEGLAMETEYHWTVAAKGNGTTYCAAGTATAQQSVTTLDACTANKAVYTLASKTSVTPSGALEGSTATFLNDGTNNDDQMTAGKTMTLTLSGYDGATIKGLTLGMHSNASKGAGTFSLVIGSTIVAEISTETAFNAWFDNTSFGTAYRNVHVPFAEEVVVGTGEDIQVIIAATENSLYCQSFSFCYDEPAAAAVEKPAFSIAGGTYTTAQSVGLSCETEGATIYYTTDGSVPDNTSTEYTGAISLSDRGTYTIKAIAIKGSDESAVATAIYTINPPFAFVAELFAYLDAHSLTSLENVTVSGYVSEIVTAYSTQHSNITFNISDDGSTTAAQLQSYRGVGTDASLIEVGDKVTISGNYTVHNTTRELAAGNTITNRIAKGAVTAVAVSGTPTKTEYAANEDFDPAGLKVHATYANGFAGEITEGITWGNDLTDGKVTENTTVHVTATVSGQTSPAYDVTVTVAAKTLESIAVGTASYSIYTGEVLPKPVVTATFSEGDPEDVSAFAVYDSESVFNTEVIDNPDPQTITVSYTFGGETKTATYTVSVKDYANTYANPYTPEEALYITTHAIGATKAARDIYVQGIVSRANNVGSGKQRYWISIDGETSSTEFEIYNGLYLKGDAFTDATKLVQYDEVIVVGKVIYYNSTTPEFATGESQLYSLARTPNFTIADVASLEVGADDLALAALTIETESEGAITLSIDPADAEKATIVSNAIHAVGAGTATVTANLAADGIYKAASTTFSVTVIPAQTKYAIYFDGNGNDGGSAPEAIENKAAGAEVTLPANTWTKTGFTFTGWKVFNNSTSAEVEVVAGAFEMPASDVTLQAQWAALPIWATTYSSNITVGTDIVKFSDELEAPEYAAKKTGTGSLYGSTTVTVPVSTSKLHFHAVCYGADTYAVTLKVKKGDNVLGTFNINKDAGAKGSSPFTLANTPYEQYYSVTLADITEPTTITFEAESGSENGKRFIIFGVNQEGGLVPVLDHIEIAGDLNTKSGYKAGDALDMTGLTVKATYTLGGTPQTPVDITDKLGDGLTLTYDPLVEGQTEVTITATYEGETDDINITLDEAVASADPKIYVDKLNVNFGTVAKDAVVEDKKITVTLTNVATATATLGGDNPEAFNIDKTALVDGDEITISVVSTATLGSYSATITISDDADNATDKVVNLSLAIEDVETPVSTTSQWVAATAADLVDGAEVLITGVKESTTYAMGADRGNNRAAVDGTLNEGVFTPGANTMSFILEDQGDGTFALRTSNGKYLYAAGSGSGNNHLKTRAAIEDGNAKWTLTATSAIANGSNTNETIRFNGSNNPEIFSCYADESKQSAIALYVPQVVTPPTPVYEVVRTGLTAGNYYTICYNKTMKSIQGASLWSFTSRDANFAYLEEATAPFVAGTPYILYAESDKLEAELEDDEVTTAGTNGALHGTFVKLVQENFDAPGAQIYLVIGNQLRLVTGRTGNTLPAYRAYVELSEIPNTGAPSSMPGRKVRSMPMQGQTATGMDELNASETPVKMLIDGQLFILRGEKMYNANGQLVK